MIIIRPERPSDVAARDALLDRAFGPGRFAKTSERLRAGNTPAAGLALVAVTPGPGGAIVGTVRLWPVAAGGRDVLLLGPLAVEPSRQGEGIGAALMHQCLTLAHQLGHAAVLLVGDAPYYARFGFSATATGALAMPGPFEPARLLARELVPGALAGAAGTITGRPAAAPPRQPAIRPARRKAGGRGAGVRHAA
jgi:predicted N-acetyltransferase YhbS